MPQQNHSRPILLETIPPVLVETMLGTVQRVDLVQRELTVLAGGQQVEVEVPVQCLVTLRGEQIKLRIIQPGDVVRIKLAAGGSRRVAQRVEVAPINSLPAAGET
ncbi:hypothetical protein NA78x_003299 [Anatilimnocola sp. NA78]|uniref:hypothetical protein n=1 Tax=Anatilimnocola sp. NA78 TaxID=3415683 RepID=UPI003CE4DFD5